MFHQSKAGYTVIVDCRSPHKVPGGKFQVRIISSSKQVSVQHENTKHVADFEDIYTPNRHMLLFRFILVLSSINVTRHQLKAPLASYASLQASLHANGFPSGVPIQQTNVIRMKLIDRGHTVCEAAGVNCCTIPVAIIFPSSSHKEGDSHQKDSSAEPEKDSEQDPSVLLIYISFFTFSA